MTLVLPIPVAAPIIAGGNIAALGGLRGLAAAIVMIGHAANAYLDAVGRGHRGDAYLAFVSLLGHKMVVLFFVLSGCVLYLALNRARETRYLTYLTRRFFRIYPAFLVALLISISLHALQDPLPRVGIGPWVNGGLVFDSAPIVALKNALFMQFKFDPPAWSLAIELQFSAVFPFLALFCRRNRNYFIVTMFVSHICGRILVDRLGVLPPYNNYQNVAEALAIFLFYLPCFGFGMVMAQLYLDRVPSLTAKRPIAETMVWITLLIAGNVIGRDIAWAVIFSILILTLCQRGVVGSFLDDRFFGYLGNISFSLYIIHFPIMLACIYQFEARCGIVATLGISTTVSLIIASIMYRYVELPGVLFGKHYGNRLVKPVVQA